VLFPALARANAQYRLDRLAASEENARDAGFEGAMWAMESAFTGRWTSPWRDADLKEQHVSADLPLAWRRHWHATGDAAFLRALWPALNATCVFWACRFTREDSPRAPPRAAGCSPKGGRGNWTLRGVVTPDESAGTVDDSAYSNAAAAATLRFCGEAAAALGVAGALPREWADMAAAPLLPLDAALSPDGPVHAEHRGYAGKALQQADVALLQYPLGLDFGAALNRRDLDYYANRTQFGNMFTGDCSYAAAYLALGDRQAADAQLAIAWSHIEPHFLAFKELAEDRGTQHFITGSGGLLQTIVFGYASLRVARLGVLSFASQRPVLPPGGVTAVKLRGLHLLGAAFDLWYDAETLCVALHGGGGGGGGGAALELRVLASGERLPLSVEQRCVPRDAVEVAGVGFP